MNERSVLTIYAEVCGWTEATQLELLLTYIENQKDQATFTDFISTIAEEELMEDQDE